MSALTLDVITDPAALPALRPEWQALWLRVADAAPFQSPAWLLPWWEVFGTRRPVVAALRQHGRLAGVLPLYLLPDGEQPRLLPIGAGLSDYTDALLDPVLPADAADVLLELALHTVQPPAPCDLVDIPAEARLRHVRPPSGWRADWRRDCACPVLAIPPAVTQVEAAIPRSQRRKLRMNRHRASRLGECTIGFADPAMVSGEVTRLLQWNAVRWGGGDPAARRFHHLATSSLAAAGLLRLATLRIAGAPAASCYALADRHGGLLFYMIGFAREFASVSPGSLLIAGMIDAAIAEGRREMHFLRGQESYKYRWGAQDRWTAACRIEAAR